MSPANQSQPSPMRPPSANAPRAKPVPKRRRRGLALGAAVAVGLALALGLGAGVLVHERMAQAQNLDVAPSDGDIPAQPAHDWEKKASKLTLWHKSHPKAPVAAQSPPPASLKFAAQLAHAGARTCLGRIEQLGHATLDSATSFGVASNWIVGSPNTRPVSVLVGEHFGSPKVPYAATAIFAAPVGAQCDGFAIEIVPSPLPCAALKQTILTRGKALADLAGVALLQNASEQTLLVPTSANTCVLVGLKHAHDR